MSPPDHPMRPVATDSKPWYRYPMVWMLIAIPASAVLVGVILISLSVRHFDGLVEDDYYKKGKEINLDLARDQFASEHGIVARVNIDPETGVVSADLSAQRAYQFPQVMGLALLHPTQSMQDRKLLLEKGPDGRYFAQLARPLVESGWYVRISEPNWRLQNRIQWPAEHPITLVP